MMSKVSRGYMILNCGFSYMYISLSLFYVGMGGFTFSMVGTRCRRGMIFVIFLVFIRIKFQL